MTMVTQTVTFTPPAGTDGATAVNAIRNLLPTPVIDFLNASDVAGTRTSTLTESSGTFTMTTQWDTSIIAEYKGMMANVSQGVKDSLAGQGWTISFSPETADL